MRFKVAGLMAIFFFGALGLSVKGIRLWRLFMVTATLQLTGDKRKGENAPRFRGCRGFRFRAWGFNIEMPQRTYTERGLSEREPPSSPGVIQGAQCLQISS